MFKVVKVKAISQNLCFFNTQVTGPGGLSIGKSEPTKRQGGPKELRVLGGCVQIQKALLYAGCPVPASFCFHCVCVHRDGLLSFFLPQA